MKLKVGDRAPEFTLVGTDLKPVSLNNFKGENLVLHFFPLAFTSVCTAQMCTAQENKDYYSGLNAKVVGVSVDSPFVLDKFAQENKLDIQLASDFNRIVSEDYGVLFKEDFMGLSQFSMRSAFLIDKEGIIRYAEITDGKSLPNVEAIKALLK